MLPGAAHASQQPGCHNFDLQMTLLALCKCLHESGQVPEARLSIELHKVRFATMQQLHPTNTTYTFQRAMQSESILTQCLSYADQYLAIELFNTCRVLSKGLRSNPQLLPGVHLTIGHQMWEWHARPGTLRLLGDCNPRTQLFHSVLAQQRDTVVISGGSKLRDLVSRCVCKNLRCFRALNSCSVLEFTLPHLKTRWIWKCCAARDQIGIAASEDHRLLGEFAAHGQEAGIPCGRFLERKAVRLRRLE